MTIATQSLHDAPTKLHVTSAGPGQIYLVSSLGKETNAQQATEYSYNQIASVLSQRRMEIVHERIFGSLSVHGAVMAARKEALITKHIPWDGPVTYVQGHPPWGEGLAGVIIHAISSARPDERVRTIRDGEIPCGRSWEQNGSTLLVLQDIQGHGDVPDVINTRPFQAWRMIFLS